MKLRYIISCLAIITLMAIPIRATNTNPVVTNVAFNINGTTVTVTYGVADAEENAVTINMEVSSDNGVTWDYNYGSASGDIGTGVATGTAKTITWTYASIYNDQFKIKIIADDLVGDQIYYAGKIYNTVTIGSQIWLKENLDVGTMIPGTSSASNNGTIEKYCYDNNTANCTTYGGLYQWNEAMQYTTAPGAKGICPTGWHIPTTAEFQTLGTTVSNNGNALKEIGQGTGAGAGTNTSGFSALIGGYRAFDGSFIAEQTTFWSSTYNAPFADNRYLVYSNFGYGSNSNNLVFGFSIRCMKD